MNRFAYGASTTGFAIGVLHMNSKHGLAVGNVQHAGTFPFPVLYEEVGVDSNDDLFNGAAYLEERLTDGAERALAKGAKIVVGACGSFAYFQKAVAERISAPVFLSVMTQMPFLLQSIGKGRLGVICASSASMNERLYEQCGVEDPSRLAIVQMKGRPQFDVMLAEEPRLDYAAFEREVVDAAKELLSAAPDVRAILLQCSDLPPFGRAIQDETGLPVFDGATLIRSLYLSANYSSYGA